MGTGRQGYSALRHHSRRLFPRLNSMCEKSYHRGNQRSLRENTGLVIIETFENRKINPVYTPAVLCQNHGPFAWGKDAAEAVHNAVVLEEVAKMARLTESVNPDVKPAPDNIKEKHFYRKHGANAYYGQN